jgi:deoxyribodipyrimidine photo-lyase
LVIYIAGINNMTTVYLFHRDLRLHDSNALFEAQERKAPVLPLFVFTPPQVSEKNALRSLNSIQFMLNSLAELEAAVKEDGGKLYFAYGETVEILRLIAKRVKIGAVVETADYTPYAKKRSELLAAFCADIGAEYVSVHDSYLFPPGTIVNKSGKTFQKFTPFYETAVKKHVAAAVGKPRLTYNSFRPGHGGTRKVRLARGFAPLALLRKRLLPVENAELAVKGGRAEGLELLKSIPKSYGKTRDILSVPTSMLSAHNHFGTVSIREVYAASSDVEFRRQLWWRDFYGCIMNDFTTLYGVGPYEFQKTASQTAAEDAAFKAWCLGKTGVPLIDAAMNQLLRTGYMHNRARMAVASWLVKDKGVHWRRGERFFAQHLVDYDAAMNMMNWIWVASVLPFASAPFRRIDAYKTAERYDPDGAYVGAWLTET